MRTVPTARRTRTSAPGNRREERHCRRQVVLEVLGTLPQPYFHSPGAQILLVNFVLLDLAYQAGCACKNDMIFIDGVIRVHSLSPIINHAKPRYAHS